jgi:ribosomal protein S18 acetylase RimI-like enzyme
MDDRGSVRIAALANRPQTVAALTDILIEAVASGGSVTFLHPLAPDVASAFWRASLAAAADGTRVVLGAHDGEVLMGTVTLVLDTPQNQQHRAEITKLMTRISHRGRGVARALMQAAERAAAERGRTLLTLDTAVDEGAGGPYEGLGFHRAGVIPDYALKPHGGLTGAIFYWKRIGTTDAA